MNNGSIGHNPCARGRRVPAGAREQGPRVVAHGRDVVVPAEWSHARETYHVGGGRGLLATLRDWAYFALLIGLLAFSCHVMWLMGAY